MSIVLDITRSALVIDYRARDWCRLPYPDHPSGCPNYRHKSTCPPAVCPIEDFIDLAAPMKLVLEPFDLGEHAAKMMSLHPDWSDRQARCVLYWQGGVNKRLREQAVRVAAPLNAVWTICPEAMGVNVIKTVKQMGIPIRTHPTDLVIKVGLVGRDAK